ncbi:hypothetical protein F5882DRAFT_407088 [Hyaloscypha sp. PMI_1271]|nr:hypothetical protein F5882DRAFT_407088 [Hyaloscypha sp. PMI_1271]
MRLGPALELILVLADPTATSCNPIPSPFAHPAPRTSLVSQARHARCTRPRCAQQPPTGYLQMAFATQRQR